MWLATICNNARAALQIHEVIASINFSDFELVYHKIRMFSART